jgi:RsiW-degrading membrane proteinase PrsW (M82 family)
MARFMWVGARDALHCDLNLAGARDFLAIAAGLSGHFRRLVWFTFAAQCWALWNVRNKLTIEGKLIGNPAGAFFQMSIHMQHWRVLARPKDHAWLDMAADEVRRLYARTRA